MVMDEKKWFQVTVPGTLSGYGDWVRPQLGERELSVGQTLSMSHSHLFSCSGAAVSWFRLTIWFKCSGHFARADTSGAVCNSRSIYGPGEFVHLRPRTFLDHSMIDLSISRHCIDSKDGTYPISDLTHHFWLGEMITQSFIYNADNSQSIYSPGEFFHLQPCTFLEHSMIDLSALHRHERWHLSH